MDANNISFQDPPTSHRKHRTANDTSTITLTITQPNMAGEGDTSRVEGRYRVLGPQQRKVSADNADDLEISFAAIDNSPVSRPSRKGSAQPNIGDRDEGMSQYSIEDSLDDSEIENFYRYLKVEGRTYILNSFRQPAVNVQQSQYSQ